MRRKEYHVDLCVVGGGLAGLCAAVAAARHGSSVVLMQDRPMLGGNASSEIRMWICGAHGKDLRETGILEELELENFYRNSGLKFSIWDTVLYEKAMSEEKLTLLLNTSCLDAIIEENQIQSVTGWQSCAETYHTVYAKYYADCSGDSILAPLTGAAYMYGREAKSDFGETIPPDIADKKTMGMSCMIQIRETDSTKKFIPPKWAYQYPTDADLPYKDHELAENTNFWWIEIGGEWDCIHDTDRCREECLKIAYGVWDHVKNRGDHGAENWELEWIGMLPGKRESRRYIGKYIVTQRDVESGGHFEDCIAYGGWSMDDHFPEGFYYRDGHPTIYHPAPSPWGLPLSCLIARDIKNLMFAGRNISITHAALSSSRVMATCALLGQALGTAAAQAVQTNRALTALDIDLLQQTLLWDDCYLPYTERKIAQEHKLHCSDSIVCNGKERGEENLWKGTEGAYLEYRFDEPVYVEQVRFVFDSDLNRDYHNMPCNYPLKQEKYKLPKTLIRDYDLVITAEDGAVYRKEYEENHERLVFHEIKQRVTGIRFVPKCTWGSEEYRVFGFDFC